MSHSDAASLISFGEAGIYLSNRFSSSADKLAQAETIMRSRGMGSDVAPEDYSARSSGWVVCGAAAVGAWAMHTVAFSFIPPARTFDTPASQQVMLQTVDHALHSGGDFERTKFAKIMHRTFELERHYLGYGPEDDRLPFHLVFASARPFSIRFARTFPKAELLRSMSDDINRNPSLDCVAAYTLTLHVLVLLSRLNPQLRLDDASVLFDAQMFDLAKPSFTIHWVLSGGLQPTAMATDIANEARFAEEVERSLRWIEGRIRLIMPEGSVYSTRPSPSSSSPAAFVPQSRQ
ncbi:hypothetical protein JCM10213v2_007987 [Rhodosporidiobolus nylandii]